MCSQKNADKFFDTSDTEISAVSTGSENDHQYRLHYFCVKIWVVRIAIPVLQKYCQYSITINTDINQPGSRNETMQLCVMLLQRHTVRCITLMHTSCQRVVVLPSHMWSTRCTPTHLATVRTWVSTVAMMMEVCLPGIVCTVQQHQQHVSVITDMIQCL